MIRNIIILSLILIAQRAIAGGDIIGKWTCMPRDEINRYSETVNDLTFNNFIVEEVNSVRFKGQKAVNPAFSIVNRNQDEYQFVSEIVGFAKGRVPIFGTSALSNPFSTVGPKSVERAGQGVLIARGEWDQIVEICVRNSAGKVEK